MSTSTFSTKLQQLSTLSILETSDTVERFELNGGLSGTIEYISRQLKSGDFSDDFTIGTIEKEEQVVAVFYIDEWTPSDISQTDFESSEFEEQYITQKKKRVDMINNSIIDISNWKVIIDEYDIKDGNGLSGQSQFLVVDPSELTDTSLMD